MKIQIDTRDRLAFIGKTGTGKSNKAKAVVAELLPTWRVVAFDPHDEWSRHGRPTPHTKLGPLRDRVMAEELCLNTELLDDPRCSLAVVPPRDRRECAAAFRDLVELVGDTGDLFLVAEELGKYAEFCDDAVIEVATELRKFGVGFAMSSQCAVQIPKMARRQISQLWSGRQDDPDDLEAIRKLTVRQDPTFSERVALLGPGELLHWRDTFYSPTARGARSTNAAEEKSK